MNTQEQFDNFIKSEMQKRIDLFNNQEFRKKCVLIAQEIGITEKEWNNNKFYFMMYVANELISLTYKNKQL